MSTHVFEVGQTVRLMANAFNPRVSGLYEVLALLPEEHGDRQYRVQNTTGPEQRVVWESQISAA